MEPITLKCSHCDTEWKLFKATTPILCPKCQEPVPTPEGFVPDPVPVPTPETPVADTLPTPDAAPPLPEPPPLRLPFREPLEMDAGERDYAEPDDEDDLPPQRRGAHPLVKVIIILLLVFILLPVAMVVLLFALCALSMR